MKKKVCMAAAVVLVACLCLTACGDGYFRATYEKDDGETFDFYKDGTVELYKDGMGIEGTYERTEKNTYELHMNAWIIQKRLIAVKDGDTLTVTEKGNPDKGYEYQLKK